MSKSLFSSECPKDYTLTEISWEKWTREFMKVTCTKPGITKSTIIKRADGAVSRFLDKGRCTSEKNAVYRYMIDEIGEVDLINSLKMTKLQKTYLWPILPAITGFIAGNISEGELQNLCHRFYVDAMTPEETKVGGKN